MSKTKEQLADEERAFMASERRNNLSDEPLSDDERRLDTILDQVREDDPHAPDDRERREERARDDERRQEKKKDHRDDDEEDDPALDKAIRTLKRVKVPESVLENTSRDDLLAWAEEVAEERRASDNSHRKGKERERSIADRLEAIEARLAGKQAKGKSGEESDANAEPDDPSAADLGLEDLVADLGLDEDGAKKLAGAFAKNRGASSDDVQSAVDAAVNPVLDELMREKVGATYPEVLDDDDIWEDVQERAERRMPLLETGEVRNLRELFMGAAEKELGRPKSRKKSSGEKRGASRPSRPSNRRPQERPKSKEETDWALFEHLEDNPGDKVGAQRAAGII